MCSIRIKVLVDKTAIDFFLPTPYTAMLQFRMIFDRIRIRIWKRLDLDPDPGLNKFSDNFFWNLFWPKYALESIFVNQKVKQQRFLMY
jgi:hypothetical protein